MNLRTLAALAAAAIACAALASAQAPSRFLQVQLDNTIKTKKAKVGDKVRAKALADTVLVNGLKVSEGDEILGQVQSVDSTSVAISFDQVLLGTKKKPLALSIRAAMAPPTTQSNDRAGVVAKAGDVVGVPGLTLQVDDSPRHASKFQSSTPDFELKHGLLLMLGLVEAAPAP